METNTQTTIKFGNDTVEVPANSLISQLISLIPDEKKPNYFKLPFAGAISEGVELTIESHEIREFNGNSYIAVNFTNGQSASFNSLLSPLSASGYDEEGENMYIPKGGTEAVLEKLHGFGAEAVKSGDFLNPGKLLNKIEYFAWLEQTLKPGMKLTLVAKLYRNFKCRKSSTDFNGNEYEPGFSRCIEQKFWRLTE